MQIPSIEIKNRFKRTCPCCKRKVINPFQFKKYEPYYCPSCHRHIIANVWISILLAITQCFICIQLFNAGFQSWGYFVLFLMFIHKILLDILDAMILPLQEHFE